MTEPETPLTRAWRDQLVREYHHLCWLYRVDLRPPVFEIIDGQSRAGSWSPGFDTLKIASWLILNHGWEVVLEVVKHEACHQYVHQVMGRGHEVPHGPAFQEACDRLGVHPDFRAATGRIPRLLPGRSGEAVPAMLARVEKLFALAQSNNEHEAALAMRKANGLLRKYNLERLARHEITAYDYVILNHHRKRLTTHQRVVAAILKDFFYVNVVIGQQFDPATAETHRVIELIGARENLAVAEYVYHFLLDRLEILWQGYRQTSPARNNEKNSYYLGVLHGFRQKLEKQDQQAMRQQGGGSSALIRAGDPGLIRFYNHRYPRLRTLSYGGPAVYADTYQAGREEGRQLVIHKGMNHRGGNNGRLLPGGS